MFFSVVRKTVLTRALASTSYVASRPTNWAPNRLSVYSNETRRDWTNGNQRTYATGTGSVSGNGNLFLAAAGALALAFGVQLFSDEQLRADGIAGTPGTKTERTFIAVKPDGVQRGLVGEVIKRFEAKGYKLVAIKIVRPTPQFAAEHYADLSSKAFFPGLVQYFSSGPVVAMVWEGAGVIKGGRALVGATNPRDALPGSIRGDLCIQVGRNIIHGSDSPESAAHEIALWFTPYEVANWNATLDQWVHEA